MKKTLSDRIAIVTGAGGGLGRSHALALAAQGAKIVVNDLATNGVSEAAEKVVEEIKQAGGEAFAHGANVANNEQVKDLIKQTVDHWGRVDILINNAGILRDRSFLKMSEEEFDQIIDVHLKGAFFCCKAVWPLMREQQYGRIVMTTSASGLYGNFGQANYAAAKMGQVGLMNTLHIEGEKYNIRVNALAPTAYTQMLEGLIGEEHAEALSVESVSPGVVYLVGENAPSKMILGAGSGGFAVNHIYESAGHYFEEDARNPESIADNLDQVSGPTPDGKLAAAFEQTKKFIELSQKAKT